MLRNEPETVHDYLQGIYSTVLLKDVVARNRIADTMILESVIRFLFDTIGNLISTKKIADSLTSAGRKTSSPTVEKYVTALINSFIIYRVHRYDIQGKQHLKTLEKYYVSDMGLRFFLLGDTKRDIGHMLENIVFLELLRRGYDVAVGKVENLEIDFVAIKGNETIYIQVTQSLADEKMREREIKPFTMLKNGFPKIIITGETLLANHVDGFPVISLTSWLQESNFL
jgi:predicted AAA+ superfamily ATPase